MATHPAHPDSPPKAAGGPSNRAPPATSFKPVGFIEVHSAPGEVAVQEPAVARGLLVHPNLWTGTATGTGSLEPRRLTPLAGDLIPRFAPPRFSPAHL